ncbi:MAG: hypothetical protein KDE09_25945, partial [Anaerolineales bacterium]|nr:hypothetical protein [Anaerolineales bacterium]
QSENKQLVAYVVPADVPPTISEIRTALQQTLADYMIPSHFVLLDELPLLPNGKVDRKGLPAPDTRRPNLETAYVAARNPQEAQLVNLWEDLLEVHPIGIHDNFFALGGHSMLAARITAALHSTFGVDLSLALLLAKPTIAEVADYLRKQGPEVVPRIAPASKGELLVPIRDQGTRPPFFLVPGGSGGESEFLLYAPLLYQLGD